MTKIYVFSGLGADSRVFKYIQITGFELVHIPWITPINKETIEQYAQRISLPFAHEKPILMGLSMGGMLAIEVSKLIETKKVILLSSIQSRSQLPSLMKFAGKLKLYKILPIRFMKWPNLFSYWFFGVDTKETKSLLDGILKDTDPVFLKWAVRVISTWQNNSIPINLYHIHGTKDHVFPNLFQNNEIKLQNGGHLMVLTEFGQVNIELEKVLTNPDNFI